MELHPGVIQLSHAIGGFKNNVSAYEQLGAIRAVLHPTEPFILFNYTDAAAHAGTWNDVEYVSRGIIFNYQTAQIVAHPFFKFFNLNERPETSLLALPDEACEITIKLDGSLGILYWTSKGPAIATRGSFTSWEALWATEYLHKHYDCSELSRTETLLFEILDPQSCLVMPSQKVPGLYLIGARRLADGDDYVYDRLVELAQRYSFPIVPRYELHHIADLVPLIATMTGIEGWVARFSNGLRIKIKTTEYLTLNHLMVQLLPHLINEKLILGADIWQAFVQSLPDDLQAEATRRATIILDAVAQEEARLRLLYAELAPLAQQSRKDFALAVMQQYKTDRIALFALLDKKELRSLLLKTMDVSHLF